MIKLRWLTVEVRRGRGQNWLRRAGVLAVWLWWAAMAGAATFTATLDRDTITLGEQATLSLSFSGGKPRGMPALPEIPNLQISGQGSSTQFSWVNGESTSTTSYNFVVTPRQAGNYAIPALAADVDGRRLTSQALTLRVLKPNAPPPEAINSGTQLAFLKLQLPKKEIYVGETVCARLELYLHNKVQNILGQPQLTSFPADGFNVGKMQEAQRRQVQVNGTVYTVIPIDVVLRAVKAGSMTLGPVTFSLVLEVASANRRRDPFDPFGMFRNTGEQKQVALVTEAEKVQLLPLPQDNVPSSFNGAIGNYTMAVTAGPTNVTAGDPITLKVQISGRGSLDTLSLPDQPAWRDFKTFPPTSKVDLGDALGLQGTKTFEQIITPQNPEIKALPSIAFSFFDPEQKAYRTLAHPAIGLTVRPGGAAPTPTMVTAARGPQDNPPPTQDIVPNKQRLGALAQVGPPLVQQPWFLAIQGLPLLALISAIIWRRQTERLANNPRLRRQRQVARVVQEGLANLRGLAAGKKSEDFFATLFHLLQEQLGERLDLPATAITEAVIEEHLRPAGVPEATLAPLQELFQTCNLARYAPVKTSQELAAMIPKLDAVLRQLREIQVERSIKGSG